MSAAGKAWSEMLVMQDLEDMMGSTKGAITEEIVSRGSESFSVPKASTSAPAKESNKECEERLEKVDQDIFDSTGDLKDVENFGVVGNFQNRKRKRNRVREGRGDSCYSSTSSLNCQDAGSSTKYWNGKKRVKYNGQRSAKSSPLSSSSGQIPASKYVPKALLSSDFDKDAFFTATFPANATPEESITFIAKTLGEQRPEIVGKVVEFVGIEKAVALFNDCRQVERDGGMLVNFGHRRRTPGGVFLQLFKMDKEISEYAKNGLSSFTKELFRANSKADGHNSLLSSANEEKPKEEVLSAKMKE